MKIAEKTCQRGRRLQPEGAPLLARLAKTLNIIILLQLIIPVGLMAVESVPDISDREIVEKLSFLEAGQKALDQRITDLRSEMKSGQESLRSEMKSGQEALRSEMKSGQEALNSRISDMNSTMIALFGAMIALIIAIFAYISWDRRTMVKPLIAQANRLERSIVSELDLYHVSGSLLQRQLKALREYAGKNPEFAEIMRGLAL